MELWFLVLFAINIGLAFIPANIASKKGYESLMPVNDKLGSNSQKFGRGMKTKQRPKSLNDNENKYSGS